MNIPISSRTAAWPALLAYLVAFVLTLCASAALVFVVAAERAAGQAARIAEEATRFALSGPGLIAVPFLNAAVLLAIALVAGRLGRGHDSVGLRLGATVGGAREGAAILFGLVGLSFACGALAELARLRDGGVMETLADNLRAPTPGRFALAIGAIGIAPAIAEETFFRGFMQPRLCAAWGRWPGIIATSVAFALMHLEWVQSSLAFVAGVFLGWAADHARGIRPTILAHAFNNALFVALAAFGADTAPSKATAVASLVAGALVWAGSIAVLREPSQRIATGPSAG